MTHLETQRQVDLQQYRTPLEILRSGERTERLEVIDIHSVSNDRSIVDENHAVQLGDSMKKDRGQLIPIGVRAREDEEGVVYDIFDGFHRTAALRSLGQDTIKANVVYGCDDQELFDLRILAASSVGSVQFARTADWISQSYAITEWAKKGLPVSRAFGAAMSNTRKINGFDFSETEVEGVKEWVFERTSKWGKNIGTVYLELMLIANADPDLVSNVRIGTGGSDRAKLITPDRLKAVVKEFPGEEGYQMQNILLDLAVDHRLRKPDLARLVSFAKGVDPKTPVSNQIDMLSDEIVRILENPEKENRETVRSLKGRIAELTKENMNLAKRVEELEKLTGVSVQGSNGNETTVFTTENGHNVSLADLSPMPLHTTDTQILDSSEYGLEDMSNVDEFDMQLQEQEDQLERIRQQEIRKTRFKNQLRGMSESEFLLHSSMMMSFFSKNSDLLIAEKIEPFNPEQGEEIYEAFEEAIMSIRMSGSVQQRWSNAAEFFARFSEYCTLEDIVDKDVDVVVPFFEYILKIPQETLEEVKKRANEYVFVENRDQATIARRHAEQSVNEIRRVVASLDDVN